MNVLEEIHNQLQLLETKQNDVRNLANIMVILTGEVKRLQDQVDRLKKDKQSKRYKQ